MLDKSLKNYLIALFGGLLAGLALIKANPIFMPISLFFLWSVRRSLSLSFLWGLIAVLVSHNWLLALHPIDWIGVPLDLSLILVISIWISCGLLGGILVSSWSLFGRITSYLLNRQNNRKIIYDENILFALFLSVVWGIAEIFLSHSPFFWIGIGGSLLPGDRLLAGMSRLIGEGGLAAIQLLFGWWIWRLFNTLLNKLENRKLFYIGAICLLILHLWGWLLLAPSQNKSKPIVPVAIWQPSIPIREKFSKDWENKLLNLLQTSLLKAKGSGAAFMVAPEGLLKANQKLLSPSPIPLLTGGFRRTQNELRSSLLVFETQENSYSSVIDKHRLVPLGEYVPKFPGFNMKGLSAVGGIYPGEKSRFLNWSGPPLAIAICYELSDGNAIANAVLDGAESILSIANLDPYPISLQRQFLSLAQLRAIETNRDIIISANTGPSSLIKSNGLISNKIPAFKEGFAVFNLEINSTTTPYALFKDLPLFLIAFFSFVLLIFQQKVDKIFSY